MTTFSDMQLKNLILAQIVKLTDSGVGARTTEAEDVWRKAIGLVKPRCGYNDGSPEADAYYRKYPERGLVKRLLTEMAAGGDIKFLSRGGYCWMVPSSYSPGFNGGTFVNQPFDLW